MQRNLDFQSTTASGTKYFAGMPGPKLVQYAAMFFQSGCDFFRLARKLLRKYGDFVVIPIGSHLHVYLNHPQYIREVLGGGYAFRTSRPQPARHFLGDGLVNSQDELHRCMRRCLRPQFSKMKVAERRALIVDEIKQHTQAWEDGDTLDMSREMTSLALAIISRIIFGYPLVHNHDGARIADAIHKVHSHSHQSVFSHCYMQLERKARWLGSRTAPARARMYLDTIIYSEIARHKSRSDEHDSSILSAVLEAQTAGEVGAYVTDDQIRHELITMLFAGHESSAMSIAWSFYLLATHPEAMDKVRQEADAARATSSWYDIDTNRLPYTSMVWKEALRMYPPIWGGVCRRAAQAVTIGGIPIPKRSLIFIVPYLIHHDARFFPDPDTFRPERFAPDAAGQIHRFAYIPFGGGHRQCIGAALAHCESVFALAMITSEWSYHLQYRQRVRMQRFITLKPKGGLRMEVHRRASD